MNQQQKTYASQVILIILGFAIYVISRNLVTVEGGVSITTILTAWRTIGVTIGTILVVSFLTMLFLIPDIGEPSNLAKPGEVANYWFNSMFMGIGVIIAMLTYWFWIQYFI